MELSASAPEVSAVPEVSAEGQESQVPQETQAQKEARYKLKVNGKDVEKTIDELIRDAQKGISADEKFQKASELAKKNAQYEEIAKRIDSGDVSFLIDKLGHNKFREFAENYLIDYLEYQQLPPEKREALEYRRQAEEYKSKLDSREAQEKEQQMATVRSQAIQEIDAEIAEVLKTSGKKPTPYFVARIAENMLASLQTKSVEPKMAAKSAYDKALSSIQADVSEYLSTMSADEARKVLPKNLLDALRKLDVEAVRSQDPMRSRATTSKTENTQTRHKDGQKVRMSTDDFFKRIEKNIGA